jgi:hypothetical protein
MSATEFKLRKLINDATYFISNAAEDETYHEKAKDCLTEGEQILLQNTRESYIELSAEVIVKLAEVSLLSGKRDDSAERILDIFFQRIQQEDQFFCQALLAYATIEVSAAMPHRFLGAQNREAREKRRGKPKTGEARVFICVTGGRNLHQNGEQAEVPIPHLQRFH